MSDRKAFNSRLRQAPKKRARKKPLPLSEVKKRFNIVTAAMLGEPEQKKHRK